ncbi:MAG: 50S ribosomal protein L4, partial [Gemmatimonadetes bacterium]|nr:50S ribosomal protein L4 [Gemmatimonadota bacterium]
DYFDGDVNEQVLHTAVRGFLNNQRQGTAATKTRSYVSGGNQKPWKQKGTGRARQGSTRAPHWRGGGVVFGPSPRDYTTDLPRKVKQLARRSALNARAREGTVHVIESIAFAAPKTSQLVELLTKLGIAEAKVLVLTATHRPSVWLSSRNLPRVDVLPYADASAYDILWAEHIVVEEAALTGSEAVANPEAPVADGKAHKAKKVAPAKVKAKAKAEKKAAKPKAEKKAPKAKAAKKPVAKKAAPKKKGGK